MRLGSSILSVLFFGVLAASPAAGAPAEKGSSILPGGNAGQPINIEAVKLDYFDKEQKLIYTGGVIAKQGDSTLKATALTILLAPKPAPTEPGAVSTTSKVDKMYAVGPVTLLQRDQVGTGDNGVYTKANNSMVLTGNVTLSQGPNVTKGDKLVYNLKTGQAVVTGRVKSMFIPDDDKTPSKTSSVAAEEQPARRSTSRKPAAGTTARGM